MNTTSQREGWRAGLAIAGRYVLLGGLLLLGCLAGRGWGADYVFVVDTSGSMTGKISRKDDRVRIAAVQEALRDYLASLPVDSRVTLISFNSGISSERELILRSDADRQAAFGWVSTLDEEARQNGDTHLWSTLRRALQVASDYFRQGLGQTVLVRVLTDGQDTERKWTLDQVLDQFPGVDGASIKTSLVLLGDLEIPLRGQRPGIEIVRDTAWELLFPPVIQHEPRAPRVQQEVTFFENSPSPYFYYDWRIDGRSVGSEKSVRVRFDRSGEHRVGLLAAGAKGNRVSAEIKVAVLEAERPEPIQVSFLYVPATPEPGQKIRLIGRCTGKPVGYTWLANGQPFAESLDTEWSSDREGSFEVTLRARDAEGRPFEKAQTVRVAELEVAVGFKAASAVMSEQAVQFVNETVGNVQRYEWDFGDATRSAERNPVHAYRNDTAEPVTFTVRLSATTPSGRTVPGQPQVIRVLPKVALPAPQAAFRILGQEFRVGRLAQFMDESSGLVSEYAWDFNGESTSAKKNPEIRFESAGEKVVRLTVRGPGGAASSEGRLTVLRPEQSITVLWLGKEGQSLPVPALLDYGRVNPINLGHGQHVVTNDEVFQVVFPAEIGSSAGLLVSFAGTGTNAFELHHHTDKGLRPLVPPVRIAETGLYRFALRTNQVEEGTFQSQCLFQAQGEDVLLNGKAEPIRMGLEVTLGKGGSPGKPLVALGFLAVLGALGAWLLIGGRRSAGVDVTLEEVAPEGTARGSAPLLPAQSFRLSAKSPTVVLGKDPDNRPSYDLKAPDSLIVRTERGVKFTPGRGAKGRELKQGEHVAFMDGAQRPRAVRVAFRSVPSAAKPKRK